MSYTIEKVVWPSNVEVAPTTKSLIRAALSLLDETDASAGRQMADEVYTDDAVVCFSTGEHQGRQAIIRSRDTAWKVVQKRRHTFNRVFANDDAGRNLMALGNVVATFKNGFEHVAPFAAQIVIDVNSEADGKPRLNRFYGYVDTAPIVLALQNMGE